MADSSAPKDVPVSSPPAPILPPSSDKSPAQPSHLPSKPHLKLQPQAKQNAKQTSPVRKPTTPVRSPPRQLFNSPQVRKPALDMKPGPASAPFRPVPLQARPPVPVLKSEADTIAPTASSKPSDIVKVKEPATSKAPIPPSPSKSSSLPIRPTPPLRTPPLLPKPLPPAPSRPLPPIPSHPLPSSLPGPTPPAPQPAPAPSHTPPLSQPTPSASPRASSTPVDGNACDRLISVARTLRAKPVYTIRRVGGEDHCPLFHAVLELHPQGYRTEGMGGSKLISRRSAAASMLKYIVALADRNGANEVASAFNLAWAEPSPDNTNAPKHPMTKGVKEEGEILPTEAEQPLFYVDRQPDPKLVKEAETVASGSTLKVEKPDLVPTKNAEELMSNGVDDVKIPRKKGLSPLRVSNSDRMKPAASSVVKRHKSAPPFKPPHPIAMTRPSPPKPQPETTAASEKIAVVSATRKSASPKRPRHPESEYNVPLEQRSYVPPRKRAKVLKELPMRLNLWVFADWRDEVSRKALEALAEASLFVELSAFVLAEIVSDNRPQLKNAVVDTTPIMKEDAEVPGSIETALAFAVGRASEQIWMLRAKHVAKNGPVALSPRIIVLRGDNSFKLVTQPGVIDVVNPANGLVEYVLRILQEAVDDL